MQSLLKKMKLSAKVVSTILLGSLVLSSTALTTSFGTQARAMELYSSSDSSSEDTETVQESTDSMMEEEYSETTILLIELEQKIRQQQQQQQQQGMDYWYSHADCSWYTGADKNTSVYYIKTAEELAGLAKLVNQGNDFHNKTINLIRDIDLKDYKWLPIGCYYNTPFKGTFDGNNFSVYNMRMCGARADLHIGLFGFIAKACIKRVNLCGESQIKAGNVNTSGTAGGFGGIVGLAEDHSIIDSCNNYSKIYSNYSAAGIVNSIRGKDVLQCVNSSNTETAAHDILDTKVINCANYGDIVVKKENGLGSQYLKSSTAGIVCDVQDSQVLNCVNYAKISKDCPSGESTATAGIAANVTGKLTRICNCMNCGEIISRVGQMECRKACCIKDPVTGVLSEECLGQIVGYARMSANISLNFHLTNPTMESKIVGLTVPCRGANMVIIRSNQGISEDEMKTDALVGKLNDFVAQNNFTPENVKLAEWTIVDNYNGYPVLLNNVVSMN